MYCSSPAASHVDYSVTVGGHLDVVRLLVQYGADVDSQDNRKITSLMIAFKRVSFRSIYVAKIYR